MGELSPSDAIALAGGNRNNGNDGFGDGNGWWIILLFMIFGWGGNRGNWGQGGGGGGYAGGDALYPWLNQAQLTTQGFADQNTVMALNGIQQGLTNGFANAATQLCNCCSEMQMALANGFFGIEQSANARQMANMQQMFAQQVATMQGFNGVQAQLADCCCENRLATANQTATLLAEHCQDRATSTANTQRILDKLCDLELQGVKQQLDDERRANATLQNQLNMANLAASQQAQNAFIAQGFANEVDQLYDRLNNCPVPSMPVYGRTPIFTCQSQNQGCGCGGYGMVA